MIRFATKHADTETRYQLLFPNGRIRHIHDRAFFTRNPIHGTSRVVGIAEDVTVTTEARLQLSRTADSLRQALDDKDVLLREIDHRVRNSLSLVSALLSMQGSRATSTDVKNALTTAAARKASSRASGSADAQLIGTDAVRQNADSLVRTMRGAVSSAVSAGRETAGAMGKAAGSTADNAEANAMNSTVGGAAGGGLYSGASGQLAAAGSLAAAGDATFEVSKGMRVLGPEGERLGKVRGVIADSHGQVQALLVKVDGETATLPAANFSGDGNAVVSAMGEGAIKDAARRQDTTSN